MGELRSLYPEIKENFSKMLKVDETHTIYYEESGNPQGVPVVFLHGGPGCGTSASGRQYFDPESIELYYLIKEEVESLRPMHV